MRPPPAETLVGQLDAVLRKAGDPERAVKEKQYLKSPIGHYGASVPAIRAAVETFSGAYGGLPRRSLLAVVRRLWSSSVHEQRMAAVLLLEAGVDLLKLEDLELVGDMIGSSFTWAYVDILAATVAGSIVERYPESTSRLDRWADDECFWLRRAAMLALMGPLRRGDGDWRRFKRYAEAMLDEKEFFIRKAIGWVLRETSKERPKLVRRFVEPRVHRMAGVTFREAVRRLPDEDRESLEAMRGGSAA